MKPQRIPFKDAVRAINDDVVDVMPQFIEALLPEGQLEGFIYVALNPTRVDRSLGSFRIEIFGEHAGRWRDWATKDGGNDFVSLIAYLKKIKQGQALILLRKMVRHHRRLEGRP